MQKFFSIKRCGSIAATVFCAVALFALSVLVLPDALAAPPPPEGPPMCGCTQEPWFDDGYEADETVSDYSALAEAILNAPTGSEPYVIKLEADIAMFTPTINIAAGQNIALVSDAPSTLTMQGSGRHFTVHGSLTLTDGIILTHSGAGSGGGVYVASPGRLYMLGGAITGNSILAEGSPESVLAGGGVYVASGVFHMHGGIISDNTTDSHGDGGGVYIASGEFRMSGGIISGNSSSSGGGVYIDNGDFYMR
jgi:hypothetical protein